MRQIIVDFGILDLAGYREYLRAIGYVLMLIGGVWSGYLAQVHRYIAGPKDSLGRQAMMLFIGGLMIGAYGVLTPRFDFHIAGYLLCFAVGFPLGVALALLRLRPAGRGPKKSAPAQPKEPHRAGRKFEFLLNLAAIVVLVGVGLMVADLAGYSMPLRIHGYGLMLVLGFLLGIYLAQRSARRAGESPQCVTHISLLALVGGIVGSRLAYVIKYWDQFSMESKPLVEIINVTSGGLIYYGGLLLATVMVLIYLWRKGLPVRRYLDIMTVSLMVGLAFGRVGCLLNGCCYGQRCSEHWALGMRFPMFAKPLVKLNGRDNPFSISTDSPSPVYAHQLAGSQLRPDERLVDAEATETTGVITLIPPRRYDAEQIAVAQTIRCEPVKPAQLLGVANALLLAVLLAWFYRLRGREGQVFALLLILYPITRFALESVRDDNAHDIARGILTHNQYTSVIIVAVGVIIMLVLRAVPASAGPVWAERLAASRSTTGKKNG